MPFESLRCGGRVHLLLDRHAGSPFPLLSGQRRHGNAGDLTYRAVSDIAANDLRTFVDLYRAQTPQ